MRFLFSILSIAYVAGIFLLAGSPLSQRWSMFNPYSLLHIPLYGILTFLLIFSFVPLKFNSSNPSNLKTSFLLAALIAAIVAIADEIYQIYVPGREASVTDVLLDFVGIAFALFLVKKWWPYFHQLNRLNKPDQ